MGSLSPLSGLYAIVDTTHESWGPLDEVARAFLDGGARLLQLRLKNRPLSVIEDWAQKIVALKAERNFIFIVNDDPYLAAKVGADGVHLGQGDLSVALARKILGPHKIIGRSNHSLKDIQHSLTLPLDYVALGAIFPTQAKGPGHPVVGLSLLKEVVSLSPLPVVAIGGIGRSTMADVLQTGVASVALISALTQGKSLEEETRYFVDCFKKRETSSLEGIL